jgi:hypothetical protein
MKIAYIDRKFNASSLAIIVKAEEICNAYAAQGFTLTLRQLFYQFVSRDLIKNSQLEYKRLGSIINDARLAGLLDWEHVEDRTRNVREVGHWKSPAEIMGAVARQYRIDKWKDQPYRPEVWIEKDALVGVLEGICRELDVPYFSCRGYTSQSEVWRASIRLAKHRSNGQTPIIIHLGDHDPSGIDMTRDITDRLTMFNLGREVEVRRIALNRDQIDQYDPPPNPAKLDDSRAAGYVALHGDSSWELDALEPSVIVELIRSTIEGLRDVPAWEASIADENVERYNLERISDRWDDVAEFINGDGTGPLEDEDYEDA